MPENTKQNFNVNREDKRLTPLAVSIEIMNLWCAQHSPLILVIACAICAIAALVFLLITFKFFATFHATAFIEPLQDRLVTLHGLIAELKNGISIKRDLLQVLKMKYETASLYYNHGNPHWVTWFVPDFSNNPTLDATLRWGYYFSLFSTSFLMPALTHVVAPSILTGQPEWTLLFKALVYSAIAIIPNAQGMPLYGRI